MGLNFGQYFEILVIFSCSFEAEVLVKIWKLTYGRDSEAVFSATLVKVLNPWVRCTFGNVCVCVCVCHTQISNTLFGEKKMTMTLYEYFQKKNFERAGLA